MDRVAVYLHCMDVYHVKAMLISGFTSFSSYAIINEVLELPISMIKDTPTLFIDMGISMLHYILGGM